MYDFKDFCDAVDFTQAVIDYKTSQRDDYAWAHGLYERIQRKQDEILRHWGLNTLFPNEEDPAPNDIETLVDVAIDSDETPYEIVRKEFGCLVLANAWKVRNRANERANEIESKWEIEY